jgi:hypothetical protein
VTKKQGAVMEPNEEGVTPQRRSLIPGASQEIPVTHDAEYVDANDQPTEVFEAFDLSEPEPEPEPAPAPRPPAFREPARALPWWRRTWVIATAAGVIVLGAAIGVIVALTGGGAPVAAPTVSPSPSQTSPSPSASAGTAARTLLDDGIAADKYPPAAPSVGAGYPDAFTMKDWVWDHVGPTWTLVSVSNYDANARTAGPSVIYLASP